MSELGCKSCVLFTHCRQESATFNLIITQPGAHLLEIPCRFANSVILHPPRVIVATDDADALRFPFSLLHIETYADAGTPKLSHLATGSSLPHRLSVRSLVPRPSGTLCPQRRRAGRKPVLASSPGTRGREAALPGERGHWAGGLSIQIRR